MSFEEIKKALKKNLKGDLSDFLDKFKLLLLDLFDIDSQQIT